MRRVSDVYFHYMARLAIAGMYNFRFSTYGRIFCPGSQSALDTFYCLKGGLKFACLQIQFGTWLGVLSITKFDICDN